MPFSPDQRKAIASKLRREGKSPEEISQFFREHGDGGLVGATRQKREGNRRSDRARAAANARHGKKRARPRRRNSGGRVQRGSASY